LVVVGTIVLLLSRPAAPEPEYQGKTVSEWLYIYAARSWSESKDFPAFKAVGTNSISYVVKHVELHDSRLRSFYKQVQGKIPFAAHRFFPPPKPLLHWSYAGMAFTEIGTDSVPHIIPLLKHPSLNIRRSVALALAELAHKTPLTRQAIPSLIETLMDDKPDVFMLHSLGAMGADASNAIPHLTNMMASTVALTNALQLQMVSVMTLGSIGPPAASALPLLNQYLKNPGFELRIRAAIAIWRINRDTNTVLPILLNDLNRAEIHHLPEMFLTLGQIGPAASNALPKMRHELATNPRWFSNQTLIAISRIESPTNQSLQSPSSE
jgi:hypothetical protein